MSDLKTGQLCTGRFKNGVECEVQKFQEPVAFPLIVEDHENMKTALETKLFPTRIDIREDIRRQIVKILNQTLATTLDLKTQIKQAHWNVKGPDFIQLHELFDELATEVEEYVDMVAERATALGGLAVGTARAAAEYSLLSEYPIDVTDQKIHLNTLADRFAAYAKHVRDAIAKTSELGDQASADLYTEIARAIDKRLWFLEAHLT
jgi:starvation-inducible DNA-binding protein